MTEKTFDTVNNPQHYAGTKIEVIDYIEDKGLGFHLGNVVKYVSRAGRKDKAKTIEDLEKAEWYLKRYIGFLKNESVEVGSTTTSTPSPDDNYITTNTISAPKMPVYNPDILTRIAISGATTKEDVDKFWNGVNAALQERQGNDKSEEEWISI